MSITAQTTSRRESVGDDIGCILGRAQLRVAIITLADARRKETVECLRKLGVAAPDGPGS